MHNCRSIYRIIELATGWNGRILHTELYFDVLDGGMVILAIFTMNIAHPGRLLGSRGGAAGEKAQSGAYEVKPKVHMQSGGSSTRSLMVQAV
jgi:hypothetical protein